MNVRGIPPKQVLGGGGRVTTLGYPSPCPDLARGLPTLDGGTYLRVPPSPYSDLAGGGYLPWTESGLPTLARVPPPPGVNRQTPVKTVPSRRTADAGGNNCYQVSKCQPVTPTWNGSTVPSCLVLNISGPSITDVFPNTTVKNDTL